MGQKVNPIGLRLGYNKNWNSRWFASKADYSKAIKEDFEVRAYIKKNLSFAGVAQIVIERSAEKINVTIHASRPGVIIGKKGSDIEKVKQSIVKITAKKEVFVNIVEVKKPEINAQLVAEGVATQLEKRVSFRRAMKRAMQSAMKFGAEGIKISCAGRLGGAEIARTEWYKEGRIPLHTIRADIDYGVARANTTYGVIGVTVHVYKGELVTYN
ncbi:MAG: 30S ribosomal protein S3 [Rickettsiales bacterium]